MHYIFAKFRVDSLSRFPFRARTQAGRHTQSHVPLTDHIQHALAANSAFKPLLNVLKKYVMLQVLVLSREISSLDPDLVALTCLWSWYTVGKSR